MKNARSGRLFTEYDDLAEQVVQQDDQNLGEEFGHTVRDAHDRHADEHDRHIHGARKQPAADEHDDLPADSLKPVLFAGKYPDPVGHVGERHRQSPGNGRGRQVMYAKQIRTYKIADDIDQGGQPTEKQIQDNLPVP